MKKIYYLTPISILLLTTWLLSCVSCRQYTETKVNISYDSLIYNAEKSAKELGYYWNIEEYGGIFKCSFYKSHGMTDMFWFTNYKIIIKREVKGNLIKVSAYNDMHFIPGYNIFDRRKSDEKEFVARITEDSEPEYIKMEKLTIPFNGFSQIRVNVNRNKITFSEYNGEINQKTLLISPALIDVIGEKILTETSLDLGRFLALYEKKGVNFKVDVFKIYDKNWRTINKKDQYRILQLLLINKFLSINQFKEWLNKNNYKY